MPTGRNPGLRGSAPQHNLQRSVAPYDGPPEERGRSRSASQSRARSASRAPSGTARPTVIPGMDPDTNRAYVLNRNVDFGGMAYTLRSGVSHYSSLFSLLCWFCRVLPGLHIAYESVSSSDFTQNSFTLRANTHSMYPALAIHKACHSIFLPSVPKGYGCKHFPVVSFILLRLYKPCSLPKLLLSFNHPSCLFSPHHYFPCHFPCHQRSFLSINHSTYETHSTFDLHQAPSCLLPTLPPLRRTPRKTPRRLPSRLYLFLINHISVGSSFQKIWLNSLLPLPWVVTIFTLLGSLLTSIVIR